MVSQHKARKYKKRSQPRRGITTSKKCGITTTTKRKDRHKSNPISIRIDSLTWITFKEICKKNGWGISETLNYLLNLVVVKHFNPYKPKKFMARIEARLRKPNSVRE